MTGEAPSARTLPGGRTAAEAQHRIATLERLLADALRENARLRTDRARWAAETERLRAEVSRLRAQVQERTRRRWP
jgi:ubiquinone biosynthesis protein UbiJ